MGVSKYIGKLFGIKEIKEVECAHVWVVTWKSRYGEYYHETTNVAKAFLSEEDARVFVQSLKDAQALLRNTENLQIKITKQAE